MFSKLTLQYGQFQKIGLEERYHRIIHEVHLRHYTLDWVAHPFYLYKTINLHKFLKLHLIGRCSYAVPFWYIFLGVQLKESSTNKMSCFVKRGFNFMGLRVIYDMCLVVYVCILCFYISIIYLRMKFFYKTISRELTMQGMS